LTEVLLEVERLAVEFRGRSFLPGRGQRIRAVDGVTFELARGETLGLVGESGSGKSSTARGILRLVEPAEGVVKLNGEDVTAASRKRMRALRREMQIVFQDTYSSLDPTMNVADLVGEPLKVHTSPTRRERDDRVRELLQQVGLAPHHMSRYSYEFSGGQRQRIAIARALALDPSFIACDEAVSGLDVSTQSQVVNLLLDLQDRLGLSYLFITHNLAVCRHVSDRIAVMYVGEIVESGPAERVYVRPAHPYTQALLSAIPEPDPRLQRARERIVLRGELPNPAAPPSGCRFHTRCPYVLDVCRVESPPLTPIEGGGTVACHLQTAGPVLAGAPLDTWARAGTQRRAS
jgi:oligopeptide/dipeptide ABC transporter ATP-binding protein